ncbi:MAG TPA: MarR family transcriptional regulator [Wenzhouxiangella sp.]|nr:MarR family transcriptional regulator [Wenzhouxiangella sp.]
MTARELKLEDFLPYRLSVLSNQVSQGISETYAERFGLSVTEWRVVAILGRFPDIPATQIVEYSAMDKVAISRAVRRLLEAGLVERQRDKSDKRAKLLTLSERGHGVYSAIVPAALAYEQHLLSALSSGEQEVLRSLLDKLENVSRPNR